MDSEPSAKVILDSISNEGHRLTTMEVVMHRFVLAEFNTHRMFSRNSASSRAIPVKKQISRVYRDPAFPIEWGLNEPGMQANTVAEGNKADEANFLWSSACLSAIAYATKLDNLGIHKQVVNRLLEPFMWHTVIVSSTEWTNFWHQRCTKHSPLAQPEMRAAADAMFEAYHASTPIELFPSEWHMPYIYPEERREFHGTALRMISAARCARVSYLTHDGVRDWSQDVELYNKLVEAMPRHESPLEHVATPTPSGIEPRGNFEGWTQLRHLV